LWMRCYNPALGRMTASDSTIQTASLGRHARRLRPAKRTFRCWHLSSRHEESGDYHVAVAILPGDPSAPRSSCHAFHRPAAAHGFLPPRAAQTRSRTCRNWRLLLASPYRERPQSRAGRRSQTITLQGTTQRGSSGPPGGNGASRRPGQASRMARTSSGVRFERPRSNTSDCWKRVSSNSLPPGSTLASI
jgi:hypothetical protein